MDKQENTESRMLEVMTFQAVDVPIYEHEGQAWITGEDIGRCLRYSEPRIAINKIFARNKEELEPLSTVTILTTVDGKLRQVRVFNEQGAYIIAMFAKTKRAKKFRLWLANLPKVLRDGGSTGAQYRELDKKIDYVMGRQSAVEDILRQLVSQQESAGLIRTERPKPLLYPRETIESDPLDEFISQEIVPDYTARIEAARLYELYQIRCQRLNCECFSRDTFNARVLDRHAFARYARSGTHPRRMSFMGLRLRGDKSHRDVREPERRRPSTEGREFDTPDRDGATAIITSNSARIFVKNECVIGREFRYPTSDLWIKYRIWCGENRVLPLGRNTFYLELRSMQGVSVGNKSCKDLNGRNRSTNFFFGLSLKGGDA